MTYTDVVQRIAYTIVDGVKVVQYLCTIPISNPKNMRLNSTRLSADLYEANRDICRADLAKFEDDAYKLRDECLKKISQE